MVQSSKFITRNCPSCGAHHGDKAHIASETPAETQSFNDLIAVWNGFFKEKSIFSYYRCENCGILYSPIYFSPEQLEELYSQMPANMDIIPKDNLQKTQNGYYRTFKEFSDLNGGYIEIGPDVGLFTSNCVRNGNFNYYWLFEPNAQVSSELESVLNGKPHKIIRDMFDFSAVPDGAASAAVMIHVLDHLIDPIKALKDLRSKLTSEAKLLIVTHDEKSLLSKVAGVRWPAYCVQHPQLYNKKSIRNLLNEAGFNVLDCQKSYNRFPVSFLFKQFMWMCGFKIHKTPNFFGLDLSLRLGNIITIASPQQ